MRVSPRLCGVCVRACVLILVLCVCAAEERANIKALALKNVSVMRQGKKKREGGGAGEAGAAEEAEVDEEGRPRAKPEGDVISMTGLVDALSTNPAFLDALANKLGVILPERKVDDSPAPTKPAKPCVIIPPYLLLCVHLLMPVVCVCVCIC